MKVDTFNSYVFLTKKQGCESKNLDKLQNSHTTAPSFKSYDVQYTRPVFAVRSRSQVAFGSAKIFSFAEGVVDKMIAGGKGAGLAQMCKLGLPVPPGFTISTAVCHEFEKLNRLPDGIFDETIAALKNVEKEMGRKFGDSEKPLLISVRSGAPESMPGMMDTILNVGLNDHTVQGLAKETNNERFAYDSYRRLIQMFGSTVKDIDSKLFEKELSKVKTEYGVKNDSDLNAEGIKKVVSGFKNIYKNATGADFPQNVNEQLEKCIETVFKSWNSPRAITYRQINKIPEEYGTAVNVQTMVFGNMGEDCATGVAFSRHPKTGESVITGDYVTNGQGEDVVAGIRETKQISDLKTEMPEVYAQLKDTINKLEKHSGDMQDTEFTVQQGKLWMLQTRNGKRTPEAAVKIAVEQVEEGLISKEQAIKNIKDPKFLTNLQFPVFDAAAKTEAVKAGRHLANGTGCAGCATGVVAFNPDRAVELAEQGKKVILVRHETSPDDIHGMAAAKGILTTTGGRTSHAAVVAMGMGKPAIVGSGSLKVDEELGTLLAPNGKLFKEGDTISIDGNTGEIFEGEITVTDPKPNEHLNKLLGWARGIKKLGVEVNADTPQDVRKAIDLGAEGVGLCRTEHMFFDKARIPVVQQMLLADTVEKRAPFINKLLPVQRQDFAGIFSALKGKPIVIRLIDPPLHEFLPKHDVLLKETTELKGKLENLQNIEQAASKLPVNQNSKGLLKLFGFENNSSFDSAKAHLQKELNAKTELMKQVEARKEANPMIGTRGCRVGITFPEITEMQTRAIIEAACDVKAKGIESHPVIEVPNVAFANEFVHQKGIIDRVAKQVMDEKGIKVDYKVAAMLETPSAALSADEIVKAGAELLSFGTNDLTQATLLASRDDTAKLFELYQRNGIIKTSPFDTITKQVADLMSLAVKKARSVDPKIEIGICGEHGGDPASIKICHELGLSNVSCSPLRLPTAQISAAQAEIAKTR